MKKLFTVLLIWASLCSFGQGNPFVFRVTSFSTCKIKVEYKRGEFVRTPVWDNGNKISTYMALDFEEMVFSVDNDMDMKLMIRDVGREDRDKDEDGDWYKMFTYTAIDNEYDECEVWVQFFDDINLIRLFVWYAEVGVVYSGHVIQSGNSQTEEINPVRVYNL